MSLVGNRGQGAIEYLLIIGAALLVVVIVIIAMSAIAASGKDTVGDGNATVSTLYTGLKDLGDGTSIAACTASFCTLNVSPAPIGGRITYSADINCGSTGAGLCTHDYNAAITPSITLTAVPAPGNIYVTWSGACSGSATTCALPINGGKTVSASFSSTPPNYTLTVNKTGSGTGTVVGSGAGSVINCGSTCSSSFPSTTATFTLTATATSGVFTGWSGDCSGTGTCSVTMTSARNVTANFGPPTFLLSVTSPSNGVISAASLADINCGTVCSKSYSPNSSVTLTATPSPGSTFTSWSGDCASFGTSTTCTLTMDAAKGVGGSFSVPGGSTLTVTPPTYGTITGTGINCGSQGTGSCSASFVTGTNVTLTATPDASGSTFNSWPVGQCSSSLNNTCVINMSSNKTASANFNTPYTLTITPPTNGIIYTDSYDINCGTVCSKVYPSGSIVMLRAGSVNGSMLESWGGSCTGNGNCSVTMNSNKTVSASFFIPSPSNLPTSLNLSGLVGYWRFNETRLQAGGPNVAKDISGNGNDLNLFNFGWLPNSSNWVDSGRPKFGNALNFDGSNDFVRGQIKNNALPRGNSTRTITMWVKVNNCSYPNYFSYGSYSSSTLFGLQGCNLSLYNCSNYYCGSYDWSPGASLLHAITPNVWTFIAVSYSGSDMFMYVDNNFATIPRNSYNTSDGNFYVGAFGEPYYGFSYFQGSIAEVTLWNRSLSYPEVISIYDNTK